MKVEKETAIALILISAGLSSVSIALRKFDISLGQNVVNNVLVQLAALNGQNRALLVTGLLLVSGSILYSVLSSRRAGK